MSGGGGGGGYTCRSEVDLDPGSNRCELNVYYSL